MPTVLAPEALQKLIYAVECGDFANIDSSDVASQSQCLDYFMQLLRYCVQAGQSTPIGLHVHPEFFAIPRVEKFFTVLFSTLDVSLRYKAEEAFQRCYAFILDFAGYPSSRHAISRLIEKLKERFPHLDEMYDKAISAITTEFFRPTIGGFLNQHESAGTHLKTAFPSVYALFVTPLDNAPFTTYKLFNFYCNPWIYHPIINYLAYHARLSSPEINRERLEKPLEQLEERLQIIRSQTNDESWKELTQKALNLCKASNNLEPFSTQSAGLLGEIRTAAQFIKNQCHPKDVLVFLPEKQNNGKNCDLMIIRHETGYYELIEIKAKSPRHGLDADTAGNVQIWDDFFSNFTHAICSFLNYLQDNVQPILGLELTKCFPHFSYFEGSNYGVALPIIGAISEHHTAANIPLSEWSSEQKLIHLLHALFLRPLVLDTACVPLASDEARLIQRQQATKEALQKEWVNTLLNKATEQLKETYQRLITEDHTVTKMYVALDFNLSYRLQQDPFSYDDGNIEEVAEKALHDAFQPFKNAFFAQSLDLDLLIVKP